jgi:adhesin/invasin
MVARVRSAASRLVVFAACLLAVACEKVPLLAPTGSTITLTVGTSALSANGSIDVIAQVLEPSGTPPHSGTEVTFTTTLGTVEPATARTDVGGRVVVRFVAGGSNGTAIITATSGGATTGTNGAIRVAVGTAAVGAVRVSASPASVSAFGGSTTITANVLDINGNPLASAPVAFASTAGTLSASVASTDPNGVAQTTLTTSQQATVTASVGAQGGSSTPPANGGTAPGTGTGTGTTTGQASGSVTVTVVAAPTLVITPPTSLPSAGLPASFTFAVTNVQNGAVARSVTVSWGDGDVQNLGAVSGNAVVSHVYEDDGGYLITATMVDSTGGTTQVSTAVTVIQAATPTVVVTPTPQSAPGGSNINFSINITVPSGISVTGVTIDFDDGFSQNLGGFSGILTVAHTYAAGVKTYTVKVNVTDSTGRTTQGTALVSITT